MDNCESSYPFLILAIFIVFWPFLTDFVHFLLIFYQKKQFFQFLIFMF